MSQYPSTGKDWAEKFKQDNDALEKGQNEEEPPKPTADVLMSRNLKGGAKKGFNFAAFGDDSSDSDVAPAPVISKPKRDFKLRFPDEEEEKPEELLPPPKKKQPAMALLIESDD